MTSKTTSWRHYEVRKPRTRRYQGHEPHFAVHEVVFKSTQFLVLQSGTGAWGVGTGAAGQYTPLIPPAVSTTATVKVASPTRWRVRPTCTLTQRNFGATGSAMRPVIVSILVSFFSVNAPLGSLYIGAKAKPKNSFDLCRSLSLLNVNNKLHYLWTHQKQHRFRSSINESLVHLY